MTFALFCIAYGCACMCVCVCMLVCVGSSLVFEQVVLQENSFH